MNNPKRNHHVTPRVYLKGFTTGGGEPFLWVYTRGLPFNPGDMNSNNPRKRSITTAGVERDGVKPYLGSFFWVLTHSISNSITATCLAGCAFNTPVQCIIS